MALTSEQMRGGKKFNFSFLMLFLASCAVQGIFFRKGKQETHASFLQAFFGKCGCNTCECFNFVLFGKCKKCKDECRRIPPECECECECNCNVWGPQVVCKKCKGGKCKKCKEQIPALKQEAEKRRVKECECECKCENVVWGHQVVCDKCKEQIPPPALKQEAEKRRVKECECECKCENVVWEHQVVCKKCKGGKCGKCKGCSGRQLWLDWVGEVGRAVREVVGRGEFVSDEQKYLIESFQDPAKAGYLIESFQEPAKAVTAILSRVEELELSQKFPEEFRELSEKFRLGFFNEDLYKIVYNCARYGRKRKRKGQGIRVEDVVDCPDLQKSCDKCQKFTRDLFDHKQPGGFPFPFPYFLCPVEDFPARAVRAAMEAWEHQMEIKKSRKSRRRRSRRARVPVI